MSAATSTEIPTSRDSDQRSSTVLVGGIEISRCAAIGTACGAPTHPSRTVPGPLLHDAFRGVLELQLVEYQMGIPK